MLLSYRQSMILSRKWKLLSQKKSNLESYRPFGCKYLPKNLQINDWFVISLLPAAIHKTTKRKIYNNQMLGEGEQI